MEMNNFFLAIVTTFFIFAGINTATAGQTKGLVFSKPIFSSNLKDNIGLLERSTITEKNFSDSLDKKRDEASPDRRENFECTHLKIPATTPDEVTTHGDARNSRAPSTVNEETLAPQSTAAVTQIDEDVISTVSTNIPNLYGHHFSSPSTGQDTRNSRAPSTVDEETLAPQSTAAAIQTDEDVISTVSTNIPNSNGQNFSSPNTEQGQNCCPWMVVGDAEYMISKKKLEFNQSRDLCQSCGGDIAVLNKTDIQEAIRNITNFFRHVNKLWIGIVRNQSRENIFEWLDGRVFPENDTAWKENQPNNKHDQQDCVALIHSCSSESESELNDRKCTDTFYALCQRSKQGCHFDGWTSWNGSCYKCFKDEATWMQAKEECNNHSAHLIFIETNEEMKFIANHGICGCNFPNDAWIGLTKENDTWVWQNGTRDFQANIQRGIDDASCEANNCCAVIHKAVMKIEWKGKKCTAHQEPFICERGNED